MSAIGQSPKHKRTRYIPQSSDPVNPSEGDFFYSDGTPRPEGLWVYTNGAWAQSGSSSQASSIVSGDNSNFEGSVGSWVAYADAAAAQPVDGTGGSPNITVARITSASDVLNGSGSMRIQKDAANRQGQGASLTISVPNFIRGQPSKLSFSAKGSANFDFGTAFSSADPSDVVFYLYDVTNSVLIQPYPYTIFSNGIVECFAQIPSTCASIRVIMHIATTNALAWDLFVDDVVLEAAVNESQNANSDWESYTPTFTGFGTVTVEDFWFRKIGDSIQIKGNFTAGTATGVEARVSLPTGLTTDSSKMSSAILMLGLLARDASATTFFHNTVLVEQSVSYLTFGEQTSVAHGSTKQLGNGLVAAGDVLSFITPPIPVRGWTSSNITAASANLNAPAILSAYKNAGSVTANTTIPTWTAEDKDSSNAFDSSTGVLTINTPGDYNMAFHVSTTAGTPLPSIRKNGTIIKTGVAVASRGVVDGLLVDLKVGDLITFTIDSSLTISSDTVSTTINVSKCELSGRVYNTRTAFVKSVKSSGTAGVGTTASVWVKQELNTIEGDSSFVSLASDVITLQPGTYMIRGDTVIGATGTSAPGNVQIRLRNTTAASTPIVGAHVKTPSLISLDILYPIFMMGKVEISTASTFEFQLIAQNTISAANAQPPASTGESEIYAQMRIEKVL